MKRKVVVVSACRTPFGSFGGSLKDISTYDLSAVVMKGLIERAGIQPSEINEIFWGVGNTAEAEDVVTPVVARQAQLKAGIPPSVVSQSIDRACCSATAAIINAVRLIRSGEIDVAIAGGVESLSRTPFVLKGTRWGKKIGHMNLEDPLFALGYKNFAPVSVDAGNGAVQAGVTRELQDEYACESQRRYQAAFDKGKYAAQIIPLEVVVKNKKVMMDRDEFPKPNTTLEYLSKLPTIYGSPTVTAGNAPGLNDGSAGILLMSEEKAKELKTQVLGYIDDFASIAAEPHLISEAPAYAIKKLFDRNNSIPMEDVSVFEINEAFAAVVLTTLRILSNGDSGREKELLQKTNVNGGAIAIGHPNAATGARIVMACIYELQDRGGGRGVASLCGGLAQADALLVRV
ncbi:thiolase family protein [Candidatus Parcubacteria bacterium]|nr:MAG: thiolase family protein [Candidatus Parcubacteria bacterium]